MTGDQPTIWFDGWLGIVRVIAIGVPSFLALLFILRTRGRRALSKMSTSDFVISVAIGAVFGRVLTADDVALVEALTALFLLLGLEYATQQLSYEHPRIHRLVNPPPSLLYLRGQLIHEHLREVRLSESDLYAVAREHGHGSLSEVEAIVLESAGQISVIPTAKHSDGAALREVMDRSDRERS